MFVRKSPVLLGLAGAMCLSGAALAGDLIYSPTNPAFGGNPDIFNYLLTTAQIQNDFVPQGGGGGGGGAPPEINFPPIVIDLGGLGTGTPDPADPDPAPDPASNASNTLSFSVGNQ